jgi:dTMP kinase
MSDSKGVFITFEGCEGAGKSTQAQRLYQYLMKNKITAVLTHEPGGTEVAEKIRSLLLDDEFKESICQKTELLLYFASRAQHIETLILPSLEKGKVVICDRFYDATVAYQGYGRGISLKEIEFMNSIAAGSLVPVMTVLIDIDVLKGIERSKNRNRVMLMKKDLNRMEQESLDFHERVRQGYLTLAGQNRDRFRVFSGELPPDELFESIRAEVMRCIENKQDA